MRSLSLLLISFFSTTVLLGQLADGSNPPTLLDDRLILEEFVSHPELSTPTGSSKVAWLDVGLALIK